MKLSVRQVRQLISEVTSDEPVFHYRYYVVDDHDAVSIAHESADFLYQRGVDVEIKENGTKESHGWPEVDVKCSRSLARKVIDYLKSADVVIIHDVDTFLPESTKMQKVALNESMFHYRFDIADDDDDNVMSVAQKEAYNLMKLGASVKIKENGPSGWPELSVSCPIIRQEEVESYIRYIMNDDNINTYRVVGSLV